MAKRIESPQNKLVKRIHGYKLRKNREKDRVFVAEGLRFVSEIPADWPVECYVVNNKKLINFTSFNADLLFYITCLCLYTYN